MKTCGFMAVGLTMSLGAWDACADLIGRWKLDEGQGTVAYDSTLGGRDAAIRGNPSWISNGRTGSALIYDGSDGTPDYISIVRTQTLNLTTGFSLSIWVWQSQPMTEYAVLSKHATGSENGWFLSLKDGKAQFFVNSESGRLVGQANLADQHWHHLAGVYDGLNQWLYVDGQLVDSGQVTLANTNSQPWMIGAAKTATGNQFNSFVGCIDEVQVYDEPLTAAEVTRLYQTPIWAIPEPATAWLLLMVAGGLGAARRRA